MSDFGEGRQIIGNKDHRCEWCGETILKGELHYQYKGMWENEWQNWRMHLECHTDATADPDSMQYGFTPYEAERPKVVRGKEGE